MARGQGARRRGRRATRATASSDGCAACTGCTVFHGHARFEAPDHGPRRRRAADRAAHLHQRRRARRASPTCPASTSVPFLTNTTILALDAVPEHLVVVGGSYIGLEFAQMYRRFGAEVTVVEMGPRLIAREDEDVSDAVREILEGEGIEVRTERRVHPLRAARRRSRQCRSTARR